MHVCAPCSHFNVHSWPVPLWKRTLHSSVMEVWWRGRLLWPQRWRGLWENWLVCCCFFFKEAKYNTSFKCSYDNSSQHLPASHFFPFFVCGWDTSLLLNSRLCCLAVLGLVKWTYRQLTDVLRNKKQQYRINKPWKLLIIHPIAGSITGKMFQIGFHKLKFPSRIYVHIWLVEHYQMWILVPHREPSLCPWSVPVWERTLHRSEKSLQWRQRLRRRNWRTAAPRLSWVDPLQQTWPNRVNHYEANSLFSGLIHFRVQAPKSRMLCRRCAFLDAGPTCGVFCPARRPALQRGQL